VRYSKNINTVNLMGERRVRLFSVCIMLLTICMLFFLTLLVHLADGLILYVLSYSAYASIFIGNLYLLVKTERKLFIAPLWVGLSFLVLGGTLFVIFAFLLWSSVLMNVLLFTLVYFVVLIAIGCLLKAIKFYSFKNKRKIGSSVFAGIFGVIVGRAFYAFVKEWYGETVVNAMMPSLLFLLSMIFGIVGVLYVNQYFLIKSGGFRNIRWND
jgi:hypothetical protein